METRLQLVDQDMTKNRVKDPTFYTRTGLTWIRTTEVPADSGFRLDIGVNAQGDVCAVRIVPVGDLVAIPEEVLQDASDVVGDAWSLKEKGLALLPEWPSLPAELQQRVNDLQARFGSNKRPNSDSVHLPEYHKVVLDIRDWEWDRRMPTGTAIERAFSVSRATAARWLTTAKKWAQEQGRDITYL